ncbi:Protein hcp1 [bioreactor metagenome]|uniref:Protein hcp1 n=1 Tax=bioreactor metagenome TaxID=1076179 RepID=A0A645ESY7_9ZZZZ
MAIGDIFLKVEGSRSGPIKGEAQDMLHKSEIDVLAWTWGMQGNASATATAASGRAGANQVALKELVVTKLVDRASTGLMSALRTNEPIKQAVLTARKAGGAKAVEYLTITLSNARISALELEGAGGGEQAAIERVSFAFQKITVEYRGQSESGGSSATSQFETDISPK